MDDIDEEILINLKEDAKGNLKKMAKKLGLPLSTLYSRIKKLENEKIIEYYSININWKKLGYLTLAYVLIFVDTTKLKELKKTQKDIVNQLQKFPFIDAAHIITGEADIIIKVRAYNTYDLGNLLTNHIQGISGIIKTKTLICLE